MISSESWMLMRKRSARELIDKKRPDPYVRQPMCKAVPGNHWAGRRLLCMLQLGLSRFRLAVPVGRYHWLSSAHFGLLTSSCIKHDKARGLCEAPTDVALCRDLQIPESRWDTISMQIKSLLSASSKSSKPAIYGAAAAIEIKRLRPLAETGKLQVGHKATGCRNASDTWLCVEA